MKVSHKARSRNAKASGCDAIANTFLDLIQCLSSGDGLDREISPILGQFTYTLTIKLISGEKLSHTAVISRFYNECLTCE